MVVEREIARRNVADAEARLQFPVGSAQRRRRILEPRRIAAASASPAAPPLPAIEVASAGRADGGIVRKIVPAILPALLSTARDAWSLTASVAGTLTAHVVPQIP